MALLRRRPRGTARSDARAHTRRDADALGPVSGRRYACSSRPRAQRSSQARWSSKTPAVAHAQYIANGPRGRELCAGDALFDHLLRGVYRDKWFDFGISNDSRGLNTGLLRNKEGFGARAVVHDHYVLELD